MMNTPYSPRIYCADPALIDPSAWPALAAHCAELGFDHLLIAAAPASDGNFSARAGGGMLSLAQLQAITIACASHHVRVLLELRIDKSDAGNPIANRYPDGFYPVPSDVIEGMQAEPHQVQARNGKLLPRWEPTTPGVRFPEDMVERLTPALDAGVAGFCCVMDDAVLPLQWAHLTVALRKQQPCCTFLAWTPDMPLLQIDSLSDCGFDAMFSSAAWWDFHASWYFRERQHIAALAAPVVFPEDPFGRRLSRQYNLDDPVLRKNAAQRALLLAAATGSGILVPMGYEYGLTQPLAISGLPDALQTPAQFEAACLHADIDLRDDIVSANQLQALHGPTAGAAKLRPLTDQAAGIALLLRTNPPSADSEGDEWLIAINTWLTQPLTLTSPYLQERLAGRVLRPESDDAAAMPAIPSMELPAASVSFLKLHHLPPIVTAPKRPRRQVERGMRGARIAIEDITPTVEGGNFAVKRVLGENVEVQADLLMDGHGRLAAALLWRAADEKNWQQVPMQPLPKDLNDRWAACLPLKRLGRYYFCIEVWQDESESDADAELSAELRPELRPFLVRSEEQSIDAERLAARFSSWYELFPRSQSGDPVRHGNFDDVIARLPAIQAMGFDTLYFPPIHPIGATNRKGPNNQLTAAAGDPGSPYAIGDPSGGHDAIHAELGTLEDFRRLRVAAAQHGLEIALDFAIQCSPDHPWLQTHPDWFNWLPDGTIRYAENPPKKYEDIVNVDFYAADAIPGLWLALRDVILFWVDEGVRVFRVDNPHTKPLPFWEWMIASVRAAHPDVIFLSEAFTRPKMMYRLAKIGFSQSYTYFTWRHDKAEFTDYLSELTGPQAREFFRPHFFVNTPDINPRFLQSAGRPGFLIRAALATMLSGLWGMYSGFELCEAAAVEGKEEYLDSEKYQLRARDWQAPGNIIAEITLLNRLRIENPALQTHLGLRFYQASNSKVLFFAKSTPAADGGGGFGDNVILVAISLDPHASQTTALELPLWEFGLPDHGKLLVEDLVQGQHFEWHGKVQNWTLHPHELPYAIWRITPNGV
ncbi:DUF3416 domain-containing protein [Herbaspirillum sp. RTI4]|uniref:alpha-1,4-glucan--maltose-1-phosphate maltosyltransferase n=1 Tax=Herbaspirillum sp. RTI4 TaxID=3048640 RepID=UPI002AB37848|nr:maltotransferase domain-containing protein [Herbaspirillum sp. RTI4]MDY7579067.1 DUF3416 domain-containing protein [Herbaspirillum sp. RTI4]MEA9982349.1 DUF3416 domain-containing protein [Herbaspirillum sp. RTI4]